MINHVVAYMGKVRKKGIRKMRDKERILMIIISRIIPGLTSCTAKKEDYIRPFIFNTHELKTRWSKIVN